jgi:multicomponent K+:H+ antiporter subunit E
LTWLLLFNSLASGHILLGTLLGLLIPLFSQTLWPDRPRVYRPWVLFTFILTVLIDIVIANLVVAKLILLHPPKSYRARFVRLPLDLQNELAITVLASTISLTPGTVSSDLNLNQRYLLIHCLDVEDEAALIARIKARYEAPLKEVFEAC